MYIRKSITKLFDGFLDKSVYRNRDISKVIAQLLLDIDTFEMAMSNAQLVVNDSKFIAKYHTIAVIIFLP